MKKIFIPAVIILLLGSLGVGYMLFNQGGGTSNPTPIDTFAKCLTEKKVVFYGAFWCPHCQNQKKLFGSAVQYLSYVECSTPDAKGQTQICKDKKIEGYPTWEFADGSRLTGEIPLATLAEKTSCELPK